MTICSLESCQDMVPLMQYFSETLQEKYLGKKKKLDFSFVDLEEAFDRVPQDVVWWATCK